MSTRLETIVNRDALTVAAIRETVTPRSMYEEPLREREEISVDLQRDEALELGMKISSLVPEVTMQQLIDAGLNAFGLQVFIESIAGKKDARTFTPLSFRFRGIKITLKPSGEIDTRHH